MAVKIQQYEDRMSPSGYGVTPQARGVQVSDAMGAAMQDMGQAGNRLAGIELHLMNQQDEANEMSAVGFALSKFKQYKEEQYQKLATSYRNPETAPKTEGEAATDTGDYTGFHSSVVKQFAEDRDAFLANIKSPRVRQYAQSHLLQLEDGYASTSLQWEAKQTIAKRDNDLVASADNYGKGLMSKLNPQEFRFANDALLGMIANNEMLTPDQKADRARKVKTTLVGFALQGVKERNPEALQDALYEMVGKEAGMSTAEVKGAAEAKPAGGAGKMSLRAENADAITATAGTLGISPDDLQTIISYETGGTFSPGKYGGKGGRHLGLIQFGPDEQKKYGVNPNQSFPEQMKAVEAYLRDRGVQPGDDLKTIYKIVNGGNRNVPDTANDGNGTIAEHVEKMRAEHGGKSLPAVTVTAKRREVDPFLRELVQQLPAEQVVPMLNQAEAEVHRQMGVARSQMEPTINNHLTMAANGDAPSQPLTEGQFMRAYGEEEGSRRYETYRTALSLAPDIQTAKTLPVAQQAAFLEARRPKPDDPLYAVKADTYQKLAQAIAQQNEARNSDPVAWAAANKFAEVQPMNFNDRAAFAAELTKRQGVAASMGQMFGTKPALLTRAEGQTLVAGFANMTTQQKLDYLKTIKGAVTDPEAYRGIIQTLAPDSPVTAIAGALMAETRSNAVPGGMMRSDTVFQPEQVAGLILEGEQLLNPSKASKAEDGRGKPLPMPPEKDMRQAFADAMRNAFAGNPMRGDVTYQAVRAYYAGKSSREGDLSGAFDGNRMKEAINAVTGGATEINGKSYVLRPWGMSESYFKDQAKKKFDEAIAANGFTDGMFDQWGAFGLETMGDPAGGGRDLYLVKTGTGYLFGRDGRPMVLDLTQAPSLIGQIPTSNAADAAQAPAPAPLPQVNQKAEKPVPMTTTKPKAK